MKKFEKIAIIGMSGRFPSASSLNDLDRIFTDRVDCVKPFSEKRRDMLKLDKTKKYFEVAYLDGVEYFDYDFFKISKYEAGCMDPQQKMVLELACEAVENAGYSLESVRGSKTSLVLGAHNSHFYDDCLDDASGVAGIGNFLDTMAGRIAYCLDLHGQAAIVETACSSSLYAIYEACIRLNAEEADMALAGGVTLEFRVKYDDYAEIDVLGLISAQARCKTFDESANGINLGEGAGFVLLKRYEDAVRDKDPIHAVIKSVAANQDGGRSNSLAAPSSAAQAEVILNAWEKADINPEDIGYIEAHGTGTKIGDPIEILGITEAYKKYTDRKQFCPIGSLKTNFSHLGSAAGIASVLKGIISLKNNKKYPLRDLQKINSLIDFKNSPVYPITELEYWDENKPKIMGISGFGVSGTNVHLILEENKTKFSKMDDEKEYFVTISGKTADTIEDYKKILIADLERHSLGDICYTLNTGRDDYNFRTSAKVKNKKEFLDFLNSRAAVSEADKHKIVFLVSGDTNFTEQEIDELKDNYPVFKKVYNELLQKSSIKNENMLKLIGCVAIYRQFDAWGITPEKIMGTGLGNIAVDFILNKLSFSDAEKEIKKAEYSDFNQKGFESYVKTFAEIESGRVIFVELGNRGKMLDCLNTNSDFKSLKIYTALDSENSLLDTLSVLFNYGENINWHEYYSTKENVKVHIATYPFRKTVAWPKNIINKAEHQKTEVAIDESTDLKEFLKNLWCNELDVEDIDDDEDFFDLGANSLMTMNIVSLIQKRTGVELNFDDFYSYATINELENYIKSKLDEFTPSKNMMKDDTYGIVKIERKELMKASYNQRRMLYFLETTDNASLYNMPFIFRIEGDLNIKAFLHSLEQVIERHEILHTVYEKKEGEYYQKILKNYSINSEFEDKRGTSVEEIINNIKNIWNDDFDLFNEIPIRSKLIQAEDNLYFWFINMHHIVADGSSMYVFSRDMGTYYSQYNSGSTDFKIPELKVQYVDFAEWENNFLESEKAKKQLLFWKTELQNVKGILDFPIDKERPQIQTFSGSAIEFELDKELVSKCMKYCKKNNISLFMLLETVYALELYRYSSDEDICIGAPVSNRLDEKIKEVVGFFANTVTIRNRIIPSESFKETILRNKETISKVYSNVELPFEEVISNIEFKRNMAYSPLFQYMFIFQNFAIKEIELGDVKMKFMDLETSSSKFEMTMMLFEKENGISAMIEYNTDLFYKSTVESFINAFKYMVEYVVENEETSIGNLPLEKQMDFKKSDNRDNEEDYSF